VEYKDSFNYDESDEQQRKRQEHNPNDPYGLGAASPGDPYGLSSAPLDDPYSLQPREAAPDLGPKAKKKEPADPQQKKDSEPQAPSSKSDTDHPEDKAKPLFGVSTPELEKHVGKSTDVQETQADALAKEVAAEPANDAQQKPVKAETPAPNPTAAPNLPGLPTTGGKKLSKEDQQKFGKKVGDLSDVEIHNAPKHAKYLDAEAFTIGRRIYQGKNANKDTIAHEIAHFSPQDKTTGKLRRKSSSDGWAERERQKRIAAEKAEARRKEKERKAAEKAAAERRIAAQKASAIKKEAELRALGRLNANTGRPLNPKKDLSAFEERVKKQQAIKAAERKANPKPPLRRPQPLTGRKDLSALEEKVRLGQAKKAADKQAKLQKAVQQHPGIAGVLKQPFFKNALTFGAGLMSPALGASALIGAAHWGSSAKQQTAQPAAQQTEAKPAPQPEEKKEEKGFFGKALDFGKDIVKGAAKVGEKVLNTGESAINTVTSALPIPQPLKDLANPIKLAKNVVKGATAIATAPQKAAGGLLDGAMSFGKDLFNGAKDLGKKALNTAGNVINGAKDLGSKALKGAVNLADSAIKTGTKLAKEFGEYAQKNPWEVAKMVTHGALDVLGFVPVFGAIADVANAGLYAAEGKYDMAAMSMLSAIPGVGDVLGPAAKAATMASKAIPTAAKVAKTLSKAEKVVNSPVGKAVTNGLPVAGTVATAGVQAATGDGACAVSTLANMGLPIAGKFGGKVLGKAADAAQSPAAKAAISAASKTVSTGGKYAPLAMQGKDVVDKFGQYQRGEIKAEDVVQSVAGLGTATVGMKTANRMDRSLSTKPELNVAQQPDVGLSNRGYKPQPGERTMTREEYKIQSSAARNFPGKQTEMNCAPQSCQQIIRASNGRTLSEAEMAASAKTSANYNPKTGTLASRVPDVLRAEGVKATTMPNKPERIQSALAEGKGVSSMHDAGKLWGNDAKGGHAVHVTSVVKDSKGKVTHYVINDTGTGQAGRRVTAEQYEGSLLKAPATVTEQPISHGGRTASEARRKAAKAKKTGEGDVPTGKDKSSDSGSTKDSGEVKSRADLDAENDVSLGTRKADGAEHDPDGKLKPKGTGEAFTPENFPTPELILRTNDPGMRARVAGFANKMSVGANEFKAEFSSRLSEAKTPQAREKLMEDAYQWWVQKRYGMKPDAKLLNDIQPGDPNRDPFGKIADLKEKGQSTPAYRKRDEIGQLIEQRFRGHEGDVLNNPVTLPKWVADDMGLKNQEVPGNRLLRGQAADAIDQHRQQTKPPEKQYGYEAGAEKYITETGEPGNQKILHDAGIKVFSRLMGDGSKLQDPKSMKQFSEAAYFLFHGPIKNRGSDSVIRGYVSGVGEQMSGKPVTLPHDVDIQAYARSQEDFSKWLAKSLSGGKGSGDAVGVSPQRPQTSGSTKDSGTPKSETTAPKFEKTGPHVEKETGDVSLGNKDAKRPKGDRPAVPTFKENSKGVAIPGKAEAKANAVAARKASRQPGYKPTEEDAFHIVTDAFNRGKLSKQQVVSATFDPKTQKWTLGENTGVPENLSPQLEGWKQRTQNQVNAGEIKTERWEVGNCAEPNSINNASGGQPSSLSDKKVYTLELRRIKVDSSSPRETRVFYKEPCSYCQTLHGEGVEMPQYDRWTERNGTD
jgi:Domain of unknown function (DUF4157)